MMENFKPKPKAKGVPMNENVNQVEVTQTNPQRGRKKNSESESIQELFRKLFTVFKKLESNHSNAELEKAEFFQLTKEIGISNNLADLIFNLVCLHLESVEKSKLIASIKQTIS